jgi:uncharacterized repeat protein (TIGR03803 family)
MVLPMRTRVEKLFLLPTLAVGLVLILAGRVTAQTFTPLHSFTALDQTHYTNSDGANPVAGVILSGNMLYGTAGAGGSSANGTVFKVSTDGTGFTNLHSFSYYNDGASPRAGLILSGNTLYGTASQGGEFAWGTVFAVNTDGSGFATLHSFTNGSDGASPVAGVILSGNTLYGTASQGGDFGSGTVFKVNTNGTGFTTLHSFTNGSDGASPVAGLILSGSTLYGTAVGSVSGGSSTNYNGTVFAVNTNGMGFTNLCSFINDSEGGANPYGSLVLSGNTLYGTARNGGSSLVGTVFAVNTDGTGFTILHSFTWGCDGILPWAGLILSGNTLYGTAGEGGSSGRGTVFAVNTNGTGFTTLYSFTGGSDGAYPYAGLILSSNTLYGTSADGGSSYNGTVFSLFIPPQLAIISSGTNVILTWPTNYTGFTLQSTTNLVSPAVWTTNSPDPVLVNGQNTVTNPMSCTQQFFRLSQ